MRLSSISASHYLNHRALNITIHDDTRVLMVCGTNGVGKSAIAQGIRLALTGEPIRGLMYKNQLPELITLGERDGTICVTVQEGEKLLPYRFNLRTGNYSGSSPELPGSPLSLDPEQFMALPAAERRKLLFNLAGIQLKPEAIIQSLIAKGHALAHVQVIAPSLRSGFDAAAKAAREKASEARGAWKATTGETYGEKKAVNWTAQVPATQAPTMGVEGMEEQVIALTAHLTNAKTKAEKLRADAQANLGAKDMRTAMLDLDGNLQRLEQLLEEKETKAEELETVRHAAQHKGGQTCPCPSCGEVLFWSAIGELKKWSEEKPALSPPEAHRKLTELQNAMAAHNRTIEDYQQRVADGKAARMVLTSLPPNPEPGAVREAENAVNDLQAKLAMAQADLKLCQDASDARTKADVTTGKAAVFHADVLAFENLGTAIAELPAQYLSTAIGTVQKYLDEASNTFDARVTLHDDMELYYGSFHYGLVSDSQQWRVRAAIGYALAIIGGLGVLVLDKFDVLHVLDRGLVLKWLMGQHAVQVVLCGTLKEQPKLPEPPCQVVWLEKNA